MKTTKVYVILFFLLLFLYYGKDLLFSFYISKDEYLSMPIILERDYDFLEKEYTELLKANELWDNLEYNFITSKVVVRDPYLFFDEITILKGKEDNVSVDDIIINDKGYVGKIKSVFAHHSQVELLTNKNTELQVRVKDSYGILRKEKDGLKIFDMTSKENIEVGTTIYLSNFLGIAGDIPIGKVREVIVHPLGQEIEVEVNVDFEDLSYVTIRKKGDVNEY